MVVLATAGISWFFASRGSSIEAIGFHPWPYILLVVALLGFIFAMSSATPVRRLPVPDVFRRPLRPARLAFASLVIVLAIVSVAYGNRPFPLSTPTLNYIPPGMESEGHAPYGWVLCYTKYGEFCSGSVGTMTENRGKPFIYMSILYVP